MDTAIEPASGESLSFIDAFVGVLLSPGKTFAQLASQSGKDGSALLGAVVVVCLVFALDGLRITPANHIELAVLNLPCGIFVGVLYWLLFASTLALTAACLNLPKRTMSAIYVTAGWSFAPWILMAPVFCYRSFMGPAFALIASIPFLWMLVTQIFAIKSAFEIKVWQALVLAFIVPGVFQMLQAMQFFQGIYVAFSSLIT